MHWLASSIVLQGTSIDSPAGTLFSWYTRRRTITVQFAKDDALRLWAKMSEGVHQLM